MVSRTLALASLSLSLLASACSNDPSTMRRVNANGPMPHAVDPRTGVIGVMTLRHDGMYDTALGRIENASYVTLTPPIPDDHTGQIHSVFWHDGSALAGDLTGHLFRYTPEVGWETIDASLCDPTLPQTLLADAPAQDDAWVLATGDSGATLCHFDGHEFTSAESLDFAPDQLVDFGGVLYAIDPLTSRVRMRAHDGADWTVVPGVQDDARTLDSLIVRDDAVYARFTSGADATYWRVSGASGAIEGVPGMHGERWRLDQTQQTHESCGTSFLSGEHYCNTVVDVIELRVVRIDGAETEAGYLRIDDPGSFWFDTIVTGPGQFVLTSSSGDVWVTPS